MAFAANVSKPKTISKTRAGSSRTVELKGPLPKAMNIGDGTAKKYELMGRAVWPKGWWWRRPEGKDPEGAVWWQWSQLSAPWPGGGAAKRTVPVALKKKL